MYERCIIAYEKIKKNIKISDKENNNFIQYAYFDVLAMAWIKYPQSMYSQLGNQVVGRVLNKIINQEIC